MTKIILLFIICVTILSLGVSLTIEDGEHKTKGIILWICGIVAIMLILFYMANL